MAYDVNTRPAGWLRKQIARRRKRLFALAILFVALDATIILLLSLDRNAAILVSLFSLILAVGLWSVPDELADELLRWRRGERAETAIGELLEQLRPEGFVVMHDIEQAGEGNIDHFLWGPTGVFMIESKYKSYYFRALRKARRQAKKLSIELGDHWVQPVICLHKRDRDPFEHDRVPVVPQQHLLNWIRAQKKPVVPFERLARYADTVS